MFIYNCHLATVQPVMLLSLWKLYAGFLTVFLFLFLFLFLIYKQMQYFKQNSCQNVGKKIPVQTTPLNQQCLPFFIIHEKKQTHVRKSHIFKDQHTPTKRFLNFSSVLCTHMIDTTIQSKLNLILSHSQSCIQTQTLNMRYAI